MTSHDWQLIERLPRDNMSRKGAGLLPFSNNTKSVCAFSNMAVKSCYSYPSRLSSQIDNYTTDTGFVLTDGLVTYRGEGLGRPHRSGQTRLGEPVTYPLLVDRRKSTTLTRLE